MPIVRARKLHFAIDDNRRIQSSLAEIRFNNAVGQHVTRGHVIIVHAGVSCSKSAIGIAFNIKRLYLARLTSIVQLCPLRADTVLLESA